MTNFSAYPVTVDGRRLDDLAVGLEVSALTLGGLRSGDQVLAGLDGEVASLSDSREPSMFAMGMLVKGTDADGFVPSGKDGQATYQSNLQMLKHLFAKTGTLLNVRRVVDKATSLDRTNLLTNPAFRTAPGTLEIRRNFATIRKPAAISGSVTLTEGVVFAGDTWTRVATTTNNHGVRLSVNDLTADIPNGQTMAVSWEIANPSLTTPVTVQIDWADLGSVSTVLAPGTRKRVSTSGALADYTTVMRFSDCTATEAGKDFLFRQVILEKGDTILGPYFDGSTPPDARKNWIADPLLALATGWVGVLSGGLTNAISVYSPNQPATVGDTWSIGLDITAPPEAPASGNLQTGATTGGSFGANSRGLTAFNIPAGTTQRVTNTFTLETGADGLRMLISLAAAGARITNATMERVNAAPDRPFSGSTPADAMAYSWTGGTNGSPSVQREALTPSWVGAANASVSILTGKPPTGWTALNGALIWQGADGESMRALASANAAGGAHFVLNGIVGAGDVASASAEVAQDGATPPAGSMSFVTTGVTTTVQGVPLVASPARTVLNGQRIPANATTTTIRFYLGGGNGARYTVRKTMVEKAALAGPYVDGNTAGAGWTGVPDASTSVQVSSDVQADAKVVDAITPEDQPGDYGRVAVSLKVPGVYWRSVAAILWRKAAVASGTAYSINGLEGSSAPIGDAVVCLTGPANTGVQIVDDATGQFVRLNEALPAGSVWRVNADTWESRVGVGLTVDSADTAGTDKAAVTDQSGTYPRLLRLHPRDDGTGRRLVKIKVVGAGFTAATTLDVKARRAHL